MTAKHVEERGSFVPNGYKASMMGDLGFSVSSVLSGGCLLFVPQFSFLYRMLLLSPPEEPCDAQSDLAIGSEMQMLDAPELGRQVYFLTGIKRKLDDYQTS